MIIPTTPRARNLYAQKLRKNVDNTEHAYYSEYTLINEYSYNVEQAVSALNAQVQVAGEALHNMNIAQDQLLSYFDRLHGAHHRPQQWTNNSPVSTTNDDEEEGHVEDDALVVGVNVVSWDSDSDSGATRRVSVDESIDGEGEPTVTVTLEELLDLRHSMDMIRARGQYYAINERLRRGANIHASTSRLPFDHPRNNTPRFNALIPHDLGNYTIDPRRLQPFYRPDNPLADSESDGPANDAIEVDKEENSDGATGW